MAELFSHLWSSIVALALEHPVAQSIGLFGMICGWVGFQSKSARGILLWQTAGSVFWAVHLGMLGALTGCALNVIAVARNVIYARRNGSSSPRFDYCPLFFTVVCLLSALFNHFLAGESWWCVLPALGMAVQSVILISGNAQLVRMLWLPTSLMWLVYNIAYGSIPGVLCESFNLVSLVVALLRFHGVNGKTEA